MSDRLQFTFRHMDSSDALQTLAEQKFDKLRSHFPDALRCHVILDCPSLAHHRKGNVFRAQVELTVSRAHSLVAAQAEHEDAHCAMRSAFDNALRQLEAHHDRRVG